MKRIRDVNLKGDVIFQVGSVFGPHELVTVREINTVSRSALSRAFSLGERIALAFS